MHLVTLILGLLLFPKALSALECYECIPTVPGTSCTETQRDCPASQCGAISMRTSVGETDVDVNMKTCMSSAGCGISGSMNYGISRTSMVIECCSTALCNTGYPTPLSGSTSPNGKTCYTCHGADCSSILSCDGEEDRCISTTVEVGGNKMTMKGCVSKSLCVSSSEAIPGMSAEVSCCEGDLCNSATTGTAVSLLLLAAAPLVSVSLFN